MERDLEIAREEEWQNSKRGRQITYKKMMIQKFTDDPELLSKSFYLPSKKQLCDLYWAHVVGWRIRPEKGNPDGQDEGLVVGCVQGQIQKRKNSGRSILKVKADVQHSLLYDNGFVRVRRQKR